MNLGDEYCKSIDSNRLIAFEGQFSMQKKLREYRTTFLRWLPHFVNLFG